MPQPKTNEIGAHGSPTNHCPFNALRHSDATALTRSELDSIFTQPVKSLDIANQATRHAHAQLVGPLLASTQIERAVSAPEKKDSTSEQNVDDLSHSPAGAEATKPLLTPREMLLHLSTHVNKSNISRKTRIGMFDLYAATQLCTDFVETRFSVIVSQLLSDIVNSPGTGNTS